MFYNILLAYAKSALISRVESATTSAVRGRKASRAGLDDFMTIAIEIFHQAR
jgi:hypothetical protein